MLANNITYISPSWTHRQLWTIMMSLIFILRRWERPQAALNTNVWLWLLLCEIIGRKLQPINMGSKTLCCALKGAHLALSYIECCDNEGLKVNENIYVAEQTVFFPQPTVLTECSGYYLTWMLWVTVYGNVHVFKRKAYAFYGMLSVSLCL